MAKYKKPTDLKPLAEGIPAQTNEIDRFNTVMDIDALYGMFDFYTYHLGDENTPDSEYRERSIAISKAMKESGGLLASNHQKAKKGYPGYKAFMVKKGFDVSAYGLNKTDPSNHNRLMNWVLDHLIVNGVNGVERLVGDDGYAHLATHEERCYRIIGAKRWSDVTEILSVHCQITPDWKISTTERSGGKKLPAVFAAGTHTFTNKEAVEKSGMKKKRKDALLASETFKLTSSFVVPVYNNTGEQEIIEETGVLSTISEGEFCKCSIKRGNNRVSAYHVDHDTLTSTERTRAGVMFDQLEKIHSAYSGAVSLTFKWREFDTVYDWGALDKAKDGEYEQIKEVISSRTLRVINKSDTTKIDKVRKGIAKAIEGSEDKFTVEYGGDVCDGDLILLIVNSEESYKDRVDPYKEYKAVNYNTPSQAIVIENIDAVKKPETAILCDMAQLVIKAEVIEGKFLMERCTTPKGVWFIEPVRIEDDDVISDDEENDETEDTTDCFEYYRGIVTCDGLKFSKLNDKEISLLKDIMDDDADLVFGRKKKDGTYTKNRNPVAFYPETGKYMIFAETSRSIIPDHIYINGYKNDLIAGETQKVGRAWFERYVNNQESREKPRAAIANMLADNPDASSFGKQTVFDAISKCRQDNRDEVPNMIYKELGIQWLNISKKKIGKDLVKHKSGFNFSYKEKMYYSGSVGSHNGKNPQESFCTLYEIFTNFRELPTGMHEWFLSFSVRNKQTTVKPYFCKHVREFAHIDRFKPAGTIESVAPVDKAPEVDPLAALAAIH